MWNQKTKQHNALITLVLLRRTEIDTYFKLGIHCDNTNFVHERFEYLVKMFPVSFYFREFILKLDIKLSKFVVVPFMRSVDLQKMQETVYSLSIISFCFFFIFCSWLQRLTLGSIPIRDRRAVWATS